MLDRESLHKWFVIDEAELTQRNYTIELSYVTPLDSLHPRSNLVARDRSMSNGPGSEEFPYSGQSFVSIAQITRIEVDKQDACAYTDCPIPANVTNQYTYEFVTLNDASLKQLQTCQADETRDLTN
jgi:hypothetical protein